jgi:type IV secretory pathway TraG/TraD family ATPase VirD4
MPQHQMLMLMDEFTAMGRVDVWAKRISIAAIRIDSHPLERLFL